MAEPAPEAARTAAHLARNAADCLPEGALEKRLSQIPPARPLRVKLGLDPTAADVHLGHTVVLQKLREFQDAGHTVVLIIGDYTARVGDPSGRSATRPVLTGEEIDANARTYVEQAGRVLRTDEQLEIRHNSEWLDMPMEALFGLVRHVTVAQLLERDDFAKRFAAHQPISLLELLYPVLQGYDSVAVDADVELGGTDQTFNLLMGRAIQSAYGKPQQVVLTVPLLVGTDGVEKMSKSIGNHVGVTDPPEEKYGKTLSIPDAAMASWYDLLLGSAPPEGVSPRDAKRALARALVTRFHGEAAAAEAEAAFDRVHIAREAPEDMPSVRLAPTNGLVHLPEVLAEHFGVSRSEARRTIAQGGVRLDGEPVTELDLPAAELDGRVLQLGRRRFVRLLTA
jgi:tyrosyl-tRNA synthetase